MPSISSARVATTPRHVATKPAFSLKQTSPGHHTATIDFRAAAALAKGKKEYLVGSTPMGDIYLTRIDLGKDFVLTNKKLPPYTVVIRPRADLPADIGIHHGNGSSSWDPPTANDKGDNIVDTGTEVVKFSKGWSHGTEKFVETLTTVLDTQNDYERRPAKPASAESKPYRESWNKDWVSADQYYSFDKGLANKSLTTVSLADFKKLPGSKQIISEIQTGGGTIADFIKRDTVKIAKDAKTGSVAVIQYVEGEMEHTMYVLDKKGKLLGQWMVDSDGRRGWIEN